MCIKNSEILVKIIGRVINIIISIFKEKNFNPAHSIKSNDQLEFKDD